MQTLGTCVAWGWGSPADSSESWGGTGRTRPLATAYFCAMLVLLLVCL